LSTQVVYQHVEVITTSDSSPQEVHQHIEFINTENHHLPETPRCSVTGTIGYKVTRAVMTPPVDVFICKCWILQAGIRNARDYFEYPCFRGRLREELIDQIDDALSTGAEIEDEMENWGHGWRTILRERRTS
jgi:hypothetical protein